MFCSNDTVTLLYRLHEINQISTKEETYRKWLKKKIKLFEKFESPKIMIRDLTYYLEQFCEKKNTETTCHYERDSI